MPFIGFLILLLAIYLLGWWSLVIVVGFIVICIITINGKDKTPRTVVNTDKIIEPKKYISKGVTNNSKSFLPSSVPVNNDLNNQSVRVSSKSLEKYIKGAIIDEDLFAETLLNEYIDIPKSKLDKMEAALEEYNKRH